jgi:Uma2 family endonuclease
MKHLLKKLPSGEIVAEGVTAEEYFAHYTGSEIRYEWVEGYVIQMAPNHEEHDFLVNYFQYLLETYLSLHPIGQLRREFTVKFPQSFREPDLFIVLNNNPNLLTKTMMQGAPDICIEMVSKESSERDYHDKRTEYEVLGVREYWIIDYLTQSAAFYQLGEQGIFVQIEIDTTYSSPLLPKLKIHIPTLWQTKLPNIVEIVETVKTMLAEE